MNFKLIFIGGINRSGGSLLPRLFDGHKNFLSYPVDQGFPYNNEYFNIREIVTGAPSSVPHNFNDPVENKKNIKLFGSNKYRSVETNFENQEIPTVFDLLNIPLKYDKPIYSWGKEKSDIIGVRKNYLEKGFYDNINTDFDFKNFLTSFQEYNSKSRSLEDTLNAKHKAFFESWDKGRLINNESSHIVMQTSNGLYLTDLEKFFKEFQDSRFIVPIKNIHSYIASEKIRLARIFYGTRRFSRPRMPWYFIKIFNQYDIYSKIRAWKCALTRVYILQREFGSDQNFLVYKHEKLAKETSSLMKTFCKNLNINFEKNLCSPTIGGFPWGGNSHYGKVSGISTNLNNYKKVLNLKEIEIIDKSIKEIKDDYENLDENFVNLSSIKENKFFEVDLQKKYFNDKTKLSMYYNIVNSGGRKVNIKKASLLSLISIISSLITFLWHIPRLIKQRFFKGVGKQNYT